MINLHSKSVNVTRADLIAALKTNMQKHVAEYNEAVSDYQAKVIADLAAALDRAKAGDFSKVSVSVQRPESHEQEFIDIIDMMEMSVDETINLESSAFKAYFRNEWPWKKAFDLIATSYKS